MGFWFQDNGKERIFNMKRNTIKWRIFKYNIIVIIMLITLTTIIFNIAVRVYIEKEIFKQLSKISTTTEDAALQHGPDFFKGPKNSMPPPLGEIKSNDIITKGDQDDKVVAFNDPNMINDDFALIEEDQFKYNQHGIYCDHSEDEEAIEFSYSKKL